MQEKIDVRALFSSNLQRLRKDAGMSQKSLATKAGITHNFVNDLENGKKGASDVTISKLSEALNAEPLQFYINPTQWENAEKQHLLAMLESLNANLNKAFDDCQKIIMKSK